MGAPAVVEFGRSRLDCKAEFEAIGVSTLIFGLTTLGAPTVWLGLGTPTQVCVLGFGG